MSRIATVLILLAAAALEAGGDALIRAGLHTHAARSRYLIFAAAAIILFAYGWTVNAPPWEFGKLLGIYVVVILIFAHLIAGLQAGPPSDSSKRWGAHLLRRRGHLIGKGVIASRAKMAT